MFCHLWRAKILQHFRLGEEVEINLTLTFCSEKICSFVNRLVHLQKGRWPVYVRGCLDPGQSVTFTSTLTEGSRILWVQLKLSGIY